MTDSISKLKDEQLEAVAGGRVPDPTGPTEPTEPSEPTGTWTKTAENPIELGDRAAGCPRSGCEKKAMKYDGVYSINVAGSWESCYTFTCEHCGAHYAKTRDENNPVWYIKL